MLSRPTQKQRTPRNHYQRVTRTRARGETSLEVAALESRPLRLTSQTDWHVYLFNSLTIFLRRPDQFRQAFGIPI